MKFKDWIDTVVSIGSLIVGIIGLIQNKKTSASRKPRKHKKKRK